MKTTLELDGQTSEKVQLLSYSGAHTVLVGDLTFNLAELAWWPSNWERHGADKEGKEAIFLNTATSSACFEIEMLKVF